MEPLEVGRWSGFFLFETPAFYFLFEAAVGSPILRGMVLLIRSVLYLYLKYVSPKFAFDKIREEEQSTK